MVDELVEQDKPLAYILGNQPFHPLPIPLLVRPPTLIPRPETEHWLAHLTTLVKAPPTRPFTILDIGTGTGCIPLALVHALRSASVNVHAVAVDKSMAAVSLANENALRCGEDVACRVKVLQADLFSTAFSSALRQVAKNGAGFDLVVSNPPYITKKDYGGLAKSVKEWEDREALVGERLGLDETRDDGLLFYRRIVDELEELLVDYHQSDSPVVALEVGAGQASAVKELVRQKGLRAESSNDQWGIERLVLGYRRAR